MEAVAVDRSAQSALTLVEGQAKGTRTAQVNVRMDAALKQAGDAALAEVGLSPSQAVRLLWAQVAKRGEDRERLLSLLQEMARDSDEELTNRLLLIERLPKIAETTCARFGLTADFESAPPLSEAEIEQAMYRDFLEEGERR